MSFSAARSRLNRRHITALDALLARWDVSTGIAPKASKNLQAENGCHVDKLAGYLEALTDREELLKCEMRESRVFFERAGNTFALAGIESDPFRGAIFGRAMLLEKFVRYLKGTFDNHQVELPCKDGLPRILKVVRSLSGVSEASAKAKYRVYINAMKRTALGKRAVFATFVKPFNPNSQPWAVPLPSGKEVQSSLALGEDPLNRDYILFAYRLPEGVAPLVPTTASPGWFYQRWFRPNPTAATDYHGWTLPLDEAGESRPEIVHAEIDGTTLLFPLYVANA